MDYTYDNEAQTNEKYVHSREKSCKTYLSEKNRLTGLYEQRTELEFGENIRWRACISDKKSKIKCDEEPEIKRFEEQKKTDAQIAMWDRRVF